MTLDWLAPVFRKPDRRPVYDWAADNVELPAALTIHGRFDVARSRQLAGPLDSLHNDHVREVSVLAPLRGGKTLIADVWIPWTICNEPGPVIFNFQKEESAKWHCESRLWPLLWGCETIARQLRQLPDDKVRATEILLPQCALIAQGPSLTNLQSKSCRYLINDEVWLYQPGRLVEAYGRVGDFAKLGLSKVLNLSQGGTPDSDWHRTWEHCRQHEWSVPCLGCGEFNRLKWTFRVEDQLRGMRWDEHRLPSGDWDIPRCLSSVRWECPRCGHAHQDTGATKSEWNRRGRYFCTTPDAVHDKHGFRWTALVDYPWKDLVEEYLRAVNAKKKGVLDGLVAFFQKRFAEFSSESALLEMESSLPASIYDPSVPWPDESFRVLTADRQAEGVFWVVVRQWSKTGESRRIYFNSVIGFDGVEQVRLNNNVAPQMTLVDCGYEAYGDTGVFAACSRRNWLAARGDKRRHFMHRTADGNALMRSYSKLEFVDPHNGASATKMKPAPMIYFSSDTMADRVKNLIKRGLWKEPAGTDALSIEYDRQMSSEYKAPRENKVTRQVEMKWICPSHNNHAFDCSKMQVLAATVRGVLPDFE